MENFVTIIDGTFATFVSTSLYTFERPKVKSTVYYYNTFFLSLSIFFSFLFLSFISLTLVLTAFLNKKTGSIILTVVLPTTEIMEPGLLALSAKNELSS